MPLGWVVDTDRTTRPAGWEDGHSPSSAAYDKVGVIVGKRSRGRRHGDARLRLLREGEAPSSKRGTTQPGDALQPLVLELRKRLRNPDPWELLAFVSTIVSVSDGSAGPDVAGTALQGLVDSFIGVDLAETTAALNVLVVLVTDPDLVREIDAELSHRSQPMPLWLKDIKETRVTRAVVMSEESGPGEDIILGIEWAGVGEASFLTYVDHSSGTVVKDAFPAPMSVAEAVVHLEAMAEDEGEDAVELEDIDLGVARAMIEEALDNGDALEYEFASDTWPSSRPILEWLVAGLPELEVDLDDLDDLDSFAEAVLRERAHVIEAFSGSEEAAAAGLRLTPAGQARDDVVMSLIGGADGYLSQEDFRRWTPERVEGLLLLALPANVMVNRVVAERVPPLLKAFASWSLSGLDVPKAEIDAVRATVDRCGPEYVAIATSKEARVLRDAIRAYERRSGLDQVALQILGTTEDVDLDTWLLEYLGAEVGGVDALMELEAAALPDEDFAWSVVPEDVRQPVGEIVELLDDFADRSFGVEFRTACRRFLAAVVAGDPVVFRRKASAASGAAVIAWLVGRANGLVAVGSDAMAAGDLWAHFGVKGASTRAETFRRAARIDPGLTSYGLGRAAWLTSGKRANLVRARDESIARRGQA
jgi:hypothetical protein